MSKTTELKDAPEAPARELYKIRDGLGITRAHQNATSAKAALIQYGVSVDVPSTRLWAAGWRAVRADGLKDTSAAIFGPESAPFRVGDTVVCRGQAYDNLPEGTRTTVRAIHWARESLVWVMSLQGHSGYWLATSFEVAPTEAKVEGV